MRSRLAAVAGFVVLVAVPLTGNAWALYQQWSTERAVTPIANQWAEDAGWDLARVELERGVLLVEALGPPPTISEEALRNALDDAGYSDLDARVILVIGGARDLPGSSDR